MRNTILEGKGIVKTFRNGFGGGAYCALNGVDICLEEGETLGLMGPSGCGKSTLARILLRLIDPDSGSVKFCGQDITTLGGKKLLPFRQQVQLISQRPESFFDPRLTLGKSLLEPLAIFHLQENNGRMLSELLEQVKLGRVLLERYPHQVSGGEIQRLSLVRALLLQPRVLVLDEPTSMLDISVQAQILQILREIRVQHRLTYLLITHDKDVASYMSDRIQLL